MKKTWTSKVSTIAKVGMVTASLVMALPMDAIACTGIYVGSNLTADGATYLGRSEDFVNGRYRKSFGIKPANDNNTGEYSSAADGGTFSRPIPKKTYKYSYVKDGAGNWDGFEEAMAEAGINENGVAISATVSTGMSEEMKKVDPLSEGGVVELNLGSILLGESTSARNACEIAGKIIDEYGAGENFHFFAADETESWIFLALSGHQWIAINMGSDCISANPNMQTLKFKIDIDDAENVMHSEKLKSLPEENNLLKTFEDGSIDIATTYGGTEDSSRCLSRYFQAAYYWNKDFANNLNVVPTEDGKQIASIDNAQLFFNGSGNYDTYTILRSLATQGEGTDWDSTQKPEIYSVGNMNQFECHFFQARQNQGYDPEMAIIEWLAPGRAEYSLYIPMYSALMTEAPVEWADGSVDAQTAPWRPTVEQMVTEALDENNADDFIYVAQDLNTLASYNREKYGKPVHEYLEKIQKEIIAQQKTADALMQNMTHEERVDAANTLAQELTTESHAYMKEILRQLRAHVKADKAAGTVTDFVPEELPKASDLLYVEHIDTPKFTADIPETVSYEQGAKADPIDLSASAAEGSVLKYSIDFEGDTERAANEITSTASFTPDTTNVGSTTYTVSVYNRAGLSDTREITVNVSKKEPEKPVDENKTPETPKPEQETKATVNKQAKASKKALPKTSDIAMPIAAFAGSGLLASAIALVQKKRKNN